MSPISDEVIAQTIEILGTTGIEDESIEQRVRELVTDDMSARRLIDWIPEAFGLVLASHLPDKLVLPATFSVKDIKGNWVELRFQVEPIFTAALKMATRLFHEGPVETFENVAARGSLTNAICRAKEKGRSMDGAVMGGPAFLGISAEVYDSTPAPATSGRSQSRKSFWQRLVSRL